MKILAGDIGGTKTRLALFEVADGRFDILAEQTFASGDYPSLEALISQFQPLQQQPVASATFGLAGPVIDQTCRITNLPWQLQASDLEQTFAIPTWLINDLEASAWGIPWLSDTEILVLQEGTAKAQGNACIIAAGTGLGEAGLYWDGTQHYPFASEGGHADFAPGSTLEFALHQHLTKAYGHVSWERLVSGPGLVDIYRFLLSYQQQQEPAWLEPTLLTGKAAASISEKALKKECPLCSEALDLFISLYGREAGNLALKQMATGGIYIGGGIAPKILPRLKDGGFVQAFNAKGRMTNLMKSMPVRVLLNDRAALLGAARYAANQA